MKRVISILVFLAITSGAWFVYSHVLDTQFPPRLQWNMDEQPNTHPNSPPAQIIAAGLSEQTHVGDSDDGAYPRDSSYFLSGLPGLENTNALPRELGSISRHREIQNLGRSRYLAHCAVCHGINGDGRGQMSQYADYPQVGDFRSADYVNMSVGKMFRSIRAGQGNMPAFGNKLTAREMWSIVVYIRQFAMESNPVKND